MCALGYESFVAAAGWNGGSVLCQVMAELLACDAHHGRPAWAQRGRGDRVPVRLFRCPHALDLVFKYSCTTMVWLSRQGPVQPELAYD